MMISTRFSWSARPRTQVSQDLNLDLPSSEGTEALPKRLFQTHNYVLTGILKSQQDGLLTRVVLAGQNLSQTGLSLEKGVVRGKMYPI